MQCTACQLVVPDHARFCLECGAPLAVSVGVPASDVEQTALEHALGAQYEIVRLLGRGGMGAVYLARERALERAVAIKLLPPGLAADAESRERFKREARTAAKLAHPNIVPLHTIGDVDGMLYFVMGFVRGESLGERMRRQGRLPPEDVRRILAELAGALDYAHRQDVIHRDIKPDNVLLDDESGRPMLTDFGVAKGRASGATLTEMGAVVGTPHYMSPEQASGERDLDGRSDIYSLGVMGYAMLSGRLPFEGGSFRDVIVQQVTMAPPPLQTLAPDVAPELVATVSRCLAKDPAARWQDGRTLKEALGVSIDEDDDWLPGELREVSSGLFWSVAGSWVLASGIWMTLHEVVFVVGAAFVIPSAFVFAAAIHHKKGYGWGEMVRVAKWPTKWWPFAWPQRWRRPGDVWNRLPRAVRWQRHFYGALICTAIIVTPFAMSPSTVPLGSLTGAILYVLLCLGMLGTARWAHLIGFPNNADLRALVFGSTTDKRFWRQPHVARLLQPAAQRGAAADPEPTTPADFVRAIVNIGPQLDGPARDLGASALIAARQVESALSQLDAEIAMLARDASPAEIAALEQKLAAVGEVAGEAASRRELREMLTNQHALLKRLADQLAATIRRRERLFDLLRTLWLQMANLRADAARDTLVDADLSGRIRSVVTEIEAYSDAAATLRVAGAE